jgi:uncharacterized Zn finger protein (UPF0148 family)
MEKLTTDGPDGYCVKERKIVAVANAESVVMRNGRSAITGNCPDCGTKIFKIGKLKGTDIYCPQCEAHPINTPDYLCRFCRFGIVVPA